MNYWTTREGKRIPVNQLTDRHLLNIHRMLNEKQRAEGVTSPNYNMINRTRLRRKLTALPIRDDKVAEFEELAESRNEYLSLCEQDTF